MSVAAAVISLSRLADDVVKKTNFIITAITRIITSLDDIVISFFFVDIHDFPCRIVTGIMNRN
jgi:hypothetical protein